MIIKTILSQLNSGDCSEGTVFGALRRMHISFAFILVLHLIDVPVIEKYLLSKYFQHFGNNHSFCNMKENPVIRRELIVHVIQPTVMI